LNEPVLT